MHFLNKMLRQNALYETNTTQVTFFCRFIGNNQKIKLNLQKNRKDMERNERIYQIFSEINKVPRPSWHEERIADWLCSFAESHGMEYQRDAQNCIVIRKAATPGHENAQPIVLHAHMDMVCVAEKGKQFDPLNDAIEAYVDNGWMKARGTSLGADNGMGLSMALAAMEDDTVVHGPLELLVTTNEEDGMTGAAALSKDFIKARRMIDLDSEDYDTITVGAAGAYLQTAELPFTKTDVKEGMEFFKIEISGGKGGHSGVDIGKGRMSAVKEICILLDRIREICPEMAVSEITAGEANASIASSAEAVVGVEEVNVAKLSNFIALYLILPEGDPDVRITCQATETPTATICPEAVEDLAESIREIPFGVIRMSQHMEGTVETSNNIGVIRTEADHFYITTHSRSFIHDDMVEIGKGIAEVLINHGATTRLVMDTPAWEENAESDYIHLVEQTFIDVLGFRPRKVEMHFVMEMGYFVDKFPGIEIVPIGPRIIEPHSTSERVELETIDNIWHVLKELLRRLA